MGESALTGSGGLARVDVSDDDDVDMRLLLTIVMTSTSAMRCMMIEELSMDERPISVDAAILTYPILTGCVRK